MTYTGATTTMVIQEEASASAAYAGVLKMINPGTLSEEILET